MAGSQVVEASPVPVVRRSVVIVVLASLLIAGLSAAPPASAEPSTAPQPGADTGASAPAGEAAADPPLAPAKADEEGRRAAAASVREAERALKLAQRHLLLLQRRMPALDAAVGKAEGHLAAVRQRELEATAVLAEARDRLRSLAVASYITGGSTPKLAYLLQADGGDDLGRRTALVGSATAMQRETVDAYEDAKAAATTEAVDASIALQEVTARRRTVLLELQRTEIEIAGHEAELADRRLLLDLVTAAAPAPPTDIPRLVLDAYQRAILAMSVRMPACRIPWTAVAALGRIESNHGRYRGARFALNGDVFPPIIGIPLDGNNNTQVIRDTDDGEYDFDVEYDRAVGPMQFIPSTWARVGLDANSDGVANPNNIYDATLSAAYYLCRAVPAGGLDSEENLAKAFFSYNHSQSYVEAGLALFRRYGELAGQLRP